METNWYVQGPACFAVDDDGIAHEPGYLLGRHYTVYPVVMLREGVHQGTSGVADYFAGAEIQQSAKTWSGKPVTIYHPTESCDDPAVLEESWIGAVYDARYDEDTQSLKAKAWIDNERGAPIIEALSQGDRLDVSVGVWGEFEPSAGTWSDKPYAATARQLVADHLAILPGKAGACSWDDGCGIREYRDGCFGFVRSTARTPTYNGTETTTWADVPKTIEVFVSAYYRERGGRPEDGPRRVRDLPSAAKRWIAGKTLLGDEGADTERDLLFFPVVNPRTGRLNAGALRAVLGGRGARAEIPAAALRSAQARARALLDKEFGDRRRRMEEASLMEQVELMDVTGAEQAPEETVEPRGKKSTPAPSATIEELLSAATPELREQLAESYALAQDMRTRAIERIAAGPVTICGDWLGRQSMETLTALDELVRLASAPAPAEPEAPKEVKQDTRRETSYMLQAGAADQLAADADKYVAPPSVEWQRVN